MKKILTASSLLLLLAGCSANNKITVPSYTAPIEISSLSKLKSGEDINSLEGSYMSLGLSPRVYFEDKKPAPEAIRMGLINQVKSSLAETKFISIYPDYRNAPVALDMAVQSYSFDKKADGISSRLAVKFFISKGTGEEVLSKVYSSEKNRSSSNPANLPSETQIMEELSKHVAKKFVTAISPRKTNQLREFKSFPSDLEYVLKMAQEGNYKDSIKALQGYKGSKDANFYYNLAVLYEAEAAKTESLILSDKAAENYKKAMTNGGSGDNVISSANSRFNQFYDLLKMTKNQRDQNKQLIEQINETYSIGE
jgi:hypothetical protein